MKKIKRKKTEKNVKASVKENVKLVKLVKA